MIFTTLNGRNETMSLCCRQQKYNEVFRALCKTTRIWWTLHVRKTLLTNNEQKGNSYNEFERHNVVVDWVERVVVSNWLFCMIIFKVSLQFHKIERVLKHLSKLYYSASLKSNFVLATQLLKKITVIPPPSLWAKSFYVDERYEW
jgi:hypothetical protein